MAKVYEGKLIYKEAKIAIVVSRFNELITKNLLNGAVDTLAKRGVPQENISIFWVPGAFEIPLVAQKTARSRNYDAVIALGAVIRGETTHFDHVANAASAGIAKINLEYEIPVIFGVLTVDTVRQATNRSGGKYGNKGREAAEAAMEMVGLLKKI